VQDRKLALSPSCVVKLIPESHSFSLVFQNLLRQKPNASLAKDRQFGDDSSKQFVRGRRERPP
jgi:hypothetical protein